MRSIDLMGQRFGLGLVDVVRGRSVAHPWADHGLEGMAAFRDVPGGIAQAERTDKFQSEHNLSFQLGQKQVVTRIDDLLAVEILVVHSLINHPQQRVELVRQRLFGRRRHVV